MYIKYKDHNGNIAISKIKNVTYEEKQDHSNMLPLHLVRFYISHNNDEYSRVNSLAKNLYNKEQAIKYIEHIVRMIENGKQLINFDNL
jgi:hypothetical protein